jgi:hypothetical protein
LVVWLTIWSLAGAALERRRPPWPPLVLAAGATVAGCLYALLAFRWVFHGGVAGGNGEYRQLIQYAPRALSALVRKTPADQSIEGYIYVGWPVAILATAGLPLALWRRPRARTYAVLTPLLLLLTYGPTIRHLTDRVGLHGFDPYRLIIDVLPLLKLQRVSGRIMVVTAMVLVLLAIVAVDALGHWLTARAARLPQLGAALLVLGALWVVNDYRVLHGVVISSQDDNQVVRTLARSGDRAGPFLGLPVLEQAYPLNSAATFLAAQSRRGTLNAYNQTAAPWLDARNRQLAPLNRGMVTDAAVAVLRATGTRQLVVIDEPNAYRPGQSRAVVDRLLASGHFQLAAEDSPLTLLTFIG